MELKVAAITGSLPVTHPGSFSRQAGQLLGGLIDPLALVALVFAIWRLGVDLNWTSSFIIANGLFSHWQVWIALAIAIKGGESLLKPSPRKPI